MQIKFTRPNTVVPFFGSDQDTSLERQQDAAKIVEFMTNLFGDRYQRTQTDLVFTVTITNMTLDELEWFNVNSSNIHSSFYPLSQHLMSYCQNNGITVETL